MKLIDEIKNFEPFDEQEIADKEFFLNSLSFFDDCLTRKNEFCHFTSSAFIVNKARTKVLAIFHNIYKSWCWIGGHADGEGDLLSVINREIVEETHLKNFKLLYDKFISVDSLPVLGHFKRGKYVPSHIHLSVAYLFEADENEFIEPKLDENSEVKWIDIEEFIKISTEPHMVKVYDKVLRKKMKWLGFVN